MWPAPSLLSRHSGHLCDHLKQAVCFRGAGVWGVEVGQDCADGELRLRWGQIVAGLRRLVNSPAALVVMWKKRWLLHGRVHIHPLELVKRSNALPRSRLWRRSRFGWEVVYGEASMDASMDAAKYMLMSRCEVTLPFNPDCCDQTTGTFLLSILNACVPKVILLYHSRTGSEKSILSNVDREAPRMSRLVTFRPAS